MILRAKVNGNERFARRLAAIAQAPANSKIVEEGATIAANAVSGAADELARRGLDAEVRIEQRGRLARDVVIEAGGLWEHEFGSRSRPASGAFAGAVAGVKGRVRQSLARRAGEAVSRAIRGRLPGDED